MAHQIEDVEVEGEEEYDEGADEDFNPEAGRQEGDASSSSEDEEEQAPVKTPKSKGRKRKSDELGDLDSGDEATIQERKNKSKKRRKDNEDEGKWDREEDSGGEGGLIKTRAQRLAEKVERKHRKKARDGEVTVDVDQLWADLTRIPIGRSNYALPRVDGDGDGDGESNKENAPVQQQKQGHDDDMITIKRRIEYAGEVTEVEDQLPRSSKEAQRYLAEHPEADPNYKAADSVDTSTPTILRPLRRPSAFEPNPTATIKGVPPEKLRPRAPSRLDVLMAERRAEEERQRKAEKMTTVQKSALDWRGFVAGQQGLREELDEYGKSKKGYLAREEFLGRAELTREIKGREARLRG